MQFLASSTRGACTQRKYQGLCQMRGTAAGLEGELFIGDKQYPPFYQMAQKPTPPPETRNHPRNQRPNRKKHHLHQPGLEYGHEKEITHQMCHRNSGQIATPGSGDGRVSSLGRFAMGHKKDKGARRNTNHGETRDSSSVHTKKFSFL